MPHFHSSQGADGAPGPPYQLEVLCAALTLLQSVVNVALTRKRSVTKLHSNLHKFIRYEIIYKLQLQLNFQRTIFYYRKLKNINYLASFHWLHLRECFCPFFYFSSPFLTKRGNVALRRWCGEHCLIGERVGMLSRAGDYCSVALGWGECSAQLGSGVSFSLQRACGKSLHC